MLDVLTIYKAVRAYDRPHPSTSTPTHRISESLPSALPTADRTHRDAVRAKDVFRNSERRSWSSEMPVHILWNVASGTRRDGQQHIRPQLRRDAQVKQLVSGRTFPDVSATRVLRGFHSQTSTISRPSVFSARYAAQGRRLHAGEDN